MPILQVVLTFHWKGNHNQDFTIPFQHQNKGGHFKEGILKLLKNSDEQQAHLGILGSCRSSQAYTIFLSKFSFHFSMETTLLCQQ